jgi:hypothetical protein
MSERFRERLRSLADREEPARPDVDAIERRGRRRRMSRRAGITAAAVTVALGIVLPISALSGLQRSDPPETAPLSSNPPSTSTQGTNSEGSAPGTEGVPDVLQVVCTPDGMELGSGEVAAQDDGVHIHVEHRDVNVPWHAVLFGQHDGRFDTFTAAGPGETVFPLPPGQLYANCADAFPTEPSGTGVQEFRVVDPRGYWVSETFACESTAKARGFRADVGALSNFEATPEDAIRNQVPGVLSTDDVLPGGYGLGQETGWMIVRRDGDVLAGFQVVRTSNDLWGVHWGETCPGSGIGEG